MDQLGLDFGTTNSTLAYFDREGKLVAYRHAGGAGGREYIPTAVARDQSGEIRIGAAALGMEGEDGWKVYRYFKMLLGCSDLALLEHHGYLPGEPEERAKEFISQLIQDFCKDHGVKKIKTLVITAPVIWIQEGQHKARESLKALGATLAIENVSIRGEPHAAIAFFAHRFAQQGTKKPFKGNVVVCDCGGGTLDFCLAAVGPENVISILQGAGSGSSEGRIGNAGLAFDEGVVERIAPELYRDKKERPTLLSDFEEKKIVQSPHYKDKLEGYVVLPQFDFPLFRVLKKFDAKASVFAEVFAATVQPSLMNELKKIDLSNIDSKNPAVFRILMVGGFSNFLLTQKAIGNHFGSNTTTDKRFDACFSAEDMGLAIAKGAALIATNRFQIEERCPISLGYVGLVLGTVGAGSQSPFQETFQTVIKKGVSMHGLQKPIFDGQEWGFEKEVGKITLFFESDYQGRKLFVLDARNSGLLSQNKPGQKYTVGFSVDEDTVFHVYLKPKDSKKPESFVLGNLIEVLRSGPIAAGR